MFGKIVAVFLIGTTLAACTGQAYMEPISQADLAKWQTSNTSFDPQKPSQAAMLGALVFLPKQVVEHDNYTLITEASGSITTNCQGFSTEKLVTIADREHPYRLYYNHGVLETYTFGYTSSADGALTGVNSQSTPDQGKTAASVATTVASLAPLVALINDKLPPGIVSVPGLTKPPSTPPAAAPHTPASVTPATSTSLPKCTAASDVSFVDVNVLPAH